MEIVGRIIKYGFRCVVCGVIFLALIALVQFWFFPVRQKEAESTAVQEFTEFCNSRGIDKRLFKGPEMVRILPKNTNSVFFAGGYFATWTYSRADGEKFKILVTVDRTGHPESTSSNNVAELETKP